jgi:hypothetical protein
MRERWDGRIFWLKRNYFSGGPLLGFFRHQIKFVPCEKHFKKKKRQDIGKCIGAIYGAMLGLHHEKDRNPLKGNTL